VKELDRLKEIKERLNKATPGEWAWRMHPKAKDLMLISNASMAPIVMRFWRWGMNSAIAVFRDFSKDILEKADKWKVHRESHHDYNLDINHPDAQLIAHAPEDIRYLVEQINELTKVIARNLVAWDTSKDKSQGLLPEVYLTNRYLYKQLTGEEYNFTAACKRFKIDYYVAFHD
jgi:hypothetical protein